MHEMAVNAVKSVDPSYSLHDFRMTIGETNLNLIFDLVMPADCKQCAEDAEQAVKEEIRKQRENCFCVIRVERPFV
jgi:hypothetical protein